MNASHARFVPSPTQLLRQPDEPRWLEELVHDIAHLPLEARLQLLRELAANMLAAMDTVHLVTVRVEMVRTTGCTSSVIALIDRQLYHRFLSVARSPQMPGRPGRLHSRVAPRQKITLRPFLRRRFTFPPHTRRR